MIDAITNKPTTTASTKTAAAKSASSSFQSALASTAAKVTEPQDTLQISGMSDWEKLAELKRLHEQTDYSGMDELERYRVIHDRFESCFPLMAMFSNIYGPLGEPLNRGSVREQVLAELDCQVEEAGIARKFGQEPLHREAYYSGLSDEEVIAAVSKKHTGNTVIDRAGMLLELSIMGLDGNKGRTYRSAIDAMRNQLVRRVTGRNNWSAMSADNPWQEMQIIQMASNTNISWGAVNQLAKEYSGKHVYVEDASLDWLLEELGKHTDSIAAKESSQRQFRLNQVQKEDVSDQTLDVGPSTSADIEAESSVVSTSTEDQKQLSEIDQGTAESTETEQTDDPLRYSGSTYSLSV